MSNGNPYRKAGILFLGMVLAWSLSALPAALLFHGAPLAVSGSAGWLCLVAGITVFFVVDSPARRSPEVKIVAILLATGIRMGVVVGGGMALYYDMLILQQNGLAFIGWTIVFYLVSLGIETGLLMKSAVVAPPAMKDGN